MAKFTQILFMLVLYLTALHIIFVVTWFAGLFYIVRLFVYHAEAEQLQEPDRSILQRQYKVMENRLWYFITTPSMLLTLVFGLWLVYEYNYWLQPWMLLKFGFVLGLIIYHCWLGVIFNQLQKDVIKYSSTQFRLINEIATLLLIAIVFIVVLKNTLSWPWGIIGLLLIGGLTVLVVKWYKKKRERGNPSSKDETIQ